MIATLDASFYDDIDLVVLASDNQNSTDPTAAEVAVAIDAQYGFYRIDNLYENWGGLNERWFKATNTSQGTWYFILQTGEVYRWDGSGQATGELIATLDSSFYDDIDLLVEAAG